MKQSTTGVTPVKYTQGKFIRVISNGIRSYRKNRSGGKINLGPIKWSAR